MNDNNNMQNDGKTISDNVIRKTGAPKNDDEYVVNIEKQTNSKPLYSDSKQTKNGEVYFANYQKNRSKTAAKIYASSYEKTAKDGKNEKISDDAEGATQLFDKVTVANKPAKSKYANAMPRKDASAQKIANAQKEPQKAEKPISRYKNTLAPKNANERINSKKVSDENDMTKNFKKEETENISKDDKKARRKAKRALRRSQPNYLKKLLASIISIVVITALLSGIGIGCINDVLAINGNDEEVTVTVSEGATTGEVIKLLKNAKLIHNKLFCNLFSDFRGYSKAKYQSGVYYLSTDMGLEGMLDELIGNSQHTSQETIQLTFPEGWTVQQMMEKLVKNEAVESNKKFLNALNFEYNYGFLTDSTEVVTKLEGFMFPETYEFYIGESASSVIRKFLNCFQSKWTKEYQQRADALGLSVNEIITIASIIQKEAGSSEQMPGVSAVIHNRLKRSVDYPYIQCDSTANYVTKYISEIVGKGKENNYKKYYDTKERVGLPAGPICNPGEQAIAAALYPDETIDALYFNHDDNGKIYYATNEVDFARNLGEANKINEELSAQYY